MIGRLIGKALLAGALCGVLGGCSANQRVASISIGETTGIATTGSLRIITERRRPGFLPVLCTEPSPDYAVAFGSTSSASGTVNPASTTVGTTTATGPGGTGSLSVATTEQVTQGNGRAAAVLALRDGLYAACQSYANGVIGHDAYAMILSQYGHLLVALVGGGAAETGRTAAAAVSLDAKKQTLSTLIVACVSGHDPTRLPPGVDAGNPLLSTRFCNRVMASALGYATRKGT